LIAHLEGCMNWQTFSPGLASHKFTTGTAHED